MKDERRPTNCGEIKSIQSYWSPHDEGNLLERRVTMENLHDFPELHNSVRFNSLLLQSTKVSLSLHYKRLWRAEKSEPVSNEFSQSRCHRQGDSVFGCQAGPGWTNNH
jgi:hypothetical protein